MEHQQKSHRKSDTLQPQQTDQQNKNQSEQPADALIQRVHAAPNSLKPADILQLQRNYGNRFTQRLLAPKISSLNPVQRTIIQRAIGMEIELDRQVSSAAGAKLPGDQLLFENDMFKLVTDSRGAYSNLELVMKHMNHHAYPDTPSAVAAVLARLGQIQVAANRLITPDPNTLIADDIVMGNSLVAGAKLGAIGKDVHRLFVQFTLGIAPEDLLKAINKLGAHSRDDEGVAKAGREVGVNAGEAVARDFGGDLGDPQKEELQGYIAFITTQIFAFARHVERGTGQIKNYTIILSRVPLKQVFNVLHPDVQGVILANQEGIVNAIATARDTDDVEYEFGDDYTRQNKPHETPLVELLQYTLSALGAAPVNIARPDSPGAEDTTYTAAAVPHIAQEDVFGGMFETGIDPTVAGGRGIPIEIRSLIGNLDGGVFMDWATLRNITQALITLSRNHFVE